LLAEEGYRVVTAENATAGLQRIEEDYFDLVLSDLMMEGMNGIQFLQELKKRFPRMMVIKITGFASIASAVEAMKLLLNYHWQGNVRELENVMERAVILCNGNTIDMEHLAFHEPGKELELLHSAVQKKLSEQELTEIYARMILEEHNGNKKEACKTLGLNFKTLQKRLGEGSASKKKQLTTDITYKYYSQHFGSESFTRYVYDRKIL